VDGFIISVSSETKSFEHFKKIQERNIPLVVFDRVTPFLNAPCVQLDNVEGGFMATEHLIEQGYKRIAILAGPKNLGISNSRMDGYIMALKKHNLKVDQDLIIHCDFNQEYAFFATQELLAMKKRPDAIFTISDRMAIGAMLAIKKKGLNMPDDIGLIGFNNEPVVSLVTPQISSMEMSSFELGKAAAKLFIETMHNQEDMTTEVRMLKAKLFARASSLKNRV
jgi:LacI family transcriptional regulator